MMMAGRGPGHKALPATEVAVGPTLGDRIPRREVSRARPPDGRVATGRPHPLHRRTIPVKIWRRALVVETDGNIGYQ